MMIYIYFRLKDYQITVESLLEVQRNLEQKIKEMEDANQVWKLFMENSRHFRVIIFLIAFM